MCQKKTHLMILEISTYSDMTTEYVDPEEETYPFKSPPQKYDCILNIAKGKKKGSQRKKRP